MARDKKNIFKFAALQSAPGEELLHKFSLDPKDLSSFILIEGDRYYRKTTAALRTAKEFGFPWSMCYILILVPPFIRNIAYNIIAKYRYKWFGKLDVCRLPGAEEREKFL